MVKCPLHFFSFFLGGFMKESKFQHDLIKKIEDRFPGCMVMKNDPNYIQGVPDLTILYKDKWATLECKKGPKEKHQPNQDYYVEKMNDMSYSAFINPSNEEEVIDAMERLFKSRSRRKPRLSGSE